MSVPDYNNPKIMEQMQREALRRVREMQERAHHTVQRSNAFLTPAPEKTPYPKSVPPPPPQSARKPDREKPQPVCKPALVQGRPGGKNKVRSFQLGGLKIDGETALVLLLVFVLVNNDGDPLLILALLYLII